jgi:hypothetical protein
VEAVRLLTGISSRLSRGDQQPEGRFSVNQNVNMAHDLGAQFIGASGRGLWQVRTHNRHAARCSGRIISATILTVIRYFVAKIVVSAEANR